MLSVILPENSTTSVIIPVSGNSTWTASLSLSIVNSRVWLSNKTEATVKSFWWNEITLSKASPLMATLPEKVLAWGWYQGKYYNFQEQTFQ